MKKILILSIVSLIAISSTALAASATYTIGFGSSQGNWQTFSDPLMYAYACPDGYNGRIDGSGRIDGHIDVGLQSVYYCWLPNFDEQEYDTRVLGRALYGGKLPLDPGAKSYSAFDDSEIDPHYEEFTWNIQAYDSSIQNFTTTTVKITGTYYDALSKTAAGIDNGKNRLVEALHANGFNRSDVNQTDTANLFLDGFEKRAADGNGFMACKITHKKVAGNQSQFLSYFSHPSPSDIYDSLRISCGPFNK